MLVHDDLTLAPSLGALSLDRLAEFAMEEELIDTFESFPDYAIIIQSDMRFVLPHRQACTFLIGMLRGRSWYLDDSEVAPPLPEVDLQETEVQLFSDEAQGPRRHLESTLDALLTFTREVGIIEGYDKDADERTVRVDISACSMTMTFIDALGYLFDCAQHEMRSMTAIA